MRVKINGEILPDDFAAMYRDWGYDTGYTNPGALREAVDANPAGEDLVLEINSVGGACDAAAEMYSVIQQAVASGMRVVAEIQSLAASAASWLALACSEVRISLSAQMMIHCSSVWTAGNAAMLRHDAELLDAQDETILNLYERKCAGKASRDTLREMLDHETYITAPEAVRLGLADSIIGGGEGAALPAVANSVQDCVVRAMRTLPDISELMERDNDRRQEEAQRQRDRLRLEAGRWA